MKRYLVLIVVLTCASFVHAQEAAPKFNLMPVPASLKFHPGERLNVDASFKVATRGHSDDRLKAAIARFVKRLEGRTVFSFAPGLAVDDQLTQLIVHTDGAGKSVPGLGENESYTIDITDRQAMLKAPTVVGAIRGLETLLQLLSADRNGFYLPGVQIQDQPRFPWRGLMIDVARHFHPVEVLKRNLDAMAAVKLNVFHWHLSEDQGFRVESKKYPKLHQLGSDGNYYTHEQIKDVIAYARERGIRVVPEFDIPGHSTSWLVGYPELGSAPGPYTIERRPGIFEPALDPTREEVYKFLDGFLSEMAALFPDEYLHIGGDENEGKQWDRNPAIQAFMKEKGIKDNHALQAYFNTRLLKILQKNNKKMIGWDEILQPGLPKDIVIHSWRGTAALADAARKGYDGILSNGFYIDLIHPASAHYTPDPVPADSTLTPEEAKHVLGGEATMWAEWVTPETIDSRIWPRTAAIAERLWSPRTVTDIDDMYRRLAIISLQLEELGLTHKRNQDMMLRRLARHDDIGPLKTLVSVIEPVKEYRRYQMRPQTMLSPLTGVIDAATPDAEGARKFSWMVREFLNDAPRYQLYRAELTQMLSDWQTSAAALGPMIDRSPALKEIKPLTKGLSDLGEVGLEAIAYLKLGQPPVREWREASGLKLDEAAKPYAALEFVNVAAVKQLVTAASELGQPRRTSSND
ncbi:MAG TPA: family 20 glycosylhydrolase [Pyrinomonadaceae bacterium]|nr:family 20 glycosylhydrolase [Pyrinomonadaceae bacterium]